MRTIDLVVLVWVFLAALTGLRRGMVAQLTALIGFGVGALIGSRVAPHLLSGSDRSLWVPVAGLVGAVVGGAVLQLAAAPVALAIRRRLMIGPLATLDRVGGLVTGALVGLGVAWLVAAAALEQQPYPWLRSDIQHSAVLQPLMRLVPPQTLLDALNRFDSLPILAAGATANLPAPLSGSVAWPAVRRSARSVVEIEGTACGLGLQGSGWVVRPGIVATNAHVIAGEHDTHVVVNGQQELQAIPVFVSAREDIALLRVPGLKLPALQTAPNDPSGTHVVLVGYPEGGPLTPFAGTVGRAAGVVAPDAYGRGPEMRTVVPLRGRLEHGDSGGPALDRNGRVVAMMFAATAEPDAGGYGVPVAQVTQASHALQQSVSSGPCVA